jgi:hypothetical protein
VNIFVIQNYFARMPPTRCHEVDCSIQRWRTGKIRSSASSLLSASGHSGSGFAGPFAVSSPTEAVSCAPLTVFAARSPSYCPLSWRGPYSENLCGLVWAKWPFIKLPIGSRTCEPGCKYVSAHILWLWMLCYVMSTWLMSTYGTQTLLVLISHGPWTHCRSPSAGIAHSILL